MRFNPVIVLAFTLTLVLISATPAYAITGNMLNYDLKSVIYEYNNHSTMTEYQDVSSYFEYGAGSNRFSGIMMYLDTGEEVDYTLTLADNSRVTGNFKVSQNLLGWYWPFTVKCEQTIDGDYDYNELYTFPPVAYAITYGVTPDPSTGYIVSLNGNYMYLWGNVTKTYTDGGAKLTVSDPISLNTQYIKHVSGTVKSGSVDIVTYTQTAPEWDSGVNDITDYRKSLNNNIIYNIEQWVAKLVNFVVQVFGILMMLADWFIFIFIENFWLTFMTYLCLTAALSVRNARGDIYRAFKLFIEYQVAFVNFIVWFIRAIIEIISRIINAIKPI